MEKNAIMIVATEPLDGVNRAIVEEQTTNNAIRAREDGKRDYPLNLILCDEFSEEDILSCLQSIEKNDRCILSRMSYELLEKFRYTIINKHNSDNVNIIITTQLPREKEHKMIRCKQLHTIYGDVVYVNTGDGVLDLVKYHEVV